MKPNIFDSKIAQQIVKSEKQWNFSVENDIPVHVIKWASNEVERQKDPASYVYNMVEAWSYSMSCIEAWEWDMNPLDVNPNLKNIVTLGYLVKPDINVKGFRKYNVSVGWDQKLDWTQIERALPNLVSEEAFESLTPTQWYKEFEEIHPFGDGNGRVGSILYNWLKGTLEWPEYPPDVYDPDFFEKKFEEDTFD